MSQRSANLVYIVLLLFVAAPAFSASEPDASERQPSADEDIENIVVTGQRPEVLRQLMTDFIIEIGDPATRGRGYARWRDRLCVGVYNLPDKLAAQYIADKISLIALQHGLRTRGPGCEPNLTIVFSPDARELASRLVAESPSMFFPYGNAEGTTQGRTALAQFETSEAPVRWWQITMVVDEVGFPAIPLPGIFPDAPPVRGVASRLKSPIYDAIWGSLTIVDAGKLDNVKWPQLADYLAMVSLAQIDPNGRPSGYDSILNLFTDDNPPRGMTDMDRTYLRALYEMDTMMLPYTQRGVFANRMVRDILKMDEEK